MAEIKKAVAKPVAAIKTEPAKSEPVKEVPSVKVENTKPVLAVKKPAAPVKTAAPAKAAAPVKAAAKTTPAKAKKAPAAKKPAVKKAAPVKKAVVKETVQFQFHGKSYTTDELIKIAKDVWKYDLKKKAGDIKSIEIYAKPEENLAYYVFNDEIAGNFTI